jgi:hypothetical protein
LIVFGAVLAQVRAVVDGLNNPMSLRDPSTGSGLAVGHPKLNLGHPSLHSTTSKGQTSELATNRTDKFAGRWGAEIRPSFLGLGFGTCRERDPGAKWCEFAMLSGQSFETLDASTLEPSDFVPKLTLYETRALH